MQKHRATGKVTAIRHQDGRAAAQPDRGALNEIAEILAAGLMRAAGAKSSRISPTSGESSLDFTPTESGHPTLDGSEKLE